MKAIFISFNQAYYESIVNLMDRINLRGFTYWNEVQGRGSHTGEPHYGNHAWPTLNAAILTMIPDEKVEHFLSLNGEKTVALGGDLDGCEALAAGMTGVESVAALYDALARRGCGEDLLADLFWNNWRRLL